MDVGDVGGVRVRVDGPGVVIVLGGQVDGALRERLETIPDRVDVAGRPITVDLSQVRFMDSTGIGFLLALRSVAQGRVRVLDPERFTAQLLDLTGVSGLFDVVHTDEVRGG